MIYILAFILCITSVWATPEKLPLPRFAAIRARVVNMHVGPGLEYPVDWTYVRPNLPVEIVAEYDHWRKIKDPDGAIGWVHKSLLSGKRGAYVHAATAPLFMTQDAVKAVAHAQKGAMGRLIQCTSIRCEVAFDGLTAWVARDNIWGAYAQEEGFKSK